MHDPDLLYFIRKLCEVLHDRQDVVDLDEELGDALSDVESQLDEIDAENNPRTENDIETLKELDENFDDGLQ